MSWICGDTCSDKISPYDEDVFWRNHEANKLIEQDRLEEQNVLKILLLGGPECGKSTMFKQMRILHTDGFSEVERKNRYKYLIYKNVFQATYQIIVGAKILNINIEEESKKSVDNFLDWYLTTYHQHLTPVGETIRTIYNAPFATKVIQRRHEIKLLDSATYFLDNIKRISDALYIPNNEDILKCRAQTTRVFEIQFRVRQHKLKMIDVGGQQSERRKWIHCFDNVHSTLFVVDISAYNEFRVDSNNEKINRFKENTNFYANILNIVYLKKAVMILFLNKVDIFEEKIKQFPLNICFPNYSSVNTLEVACNFLNAYFIAVTDTIESKNPVGINKRPLFIHFTTVTDTNMIGKIFGNCIEAVISSTMLKTEMT